MAFGQHEMVMPFGQISDPGILLLIEGMGAMVGKGCERLTFRKDIRPSDF
jgi:hypothetical protein